MTDTEIVLDARIALQKAEASQRAAVRRRDGLFEVRRGLVGRTTDPEASREAGENRDQLWNAELGVRDAETALEQARLALSAAARADANADSERRVAAAVAIRVEWLGDAGVDDALAALAAALERRNDRWKRLLGTQAYRGPELGMRASKGRLRRAFAAAGLAWLFDDHIREDEKNRLAVVDGAALKLISKPTPRTEAA